MKKENKTDIIFLTMFILLLNLTHSFSQDIKHLSGTWVNEHGTRKIEFYEEDGTYVGKVTWVQDNSKVRPGDKVFKDLLWNGKLFKGIAITPARGDISCTILFINIDKIKITGSKGSMSRSVYWTRN